jgi:hypothetical protein
MRGPSCATGYWQRADLEMSGKPGAHARRTAPLPDRAPRCSLKLADRAAVDVPASAPRGALRWPGWRRPGDPPPRLISGGADQGPPLGTVRLTVATVEIAGGEVGALVAEYLEKKRKRRLRKLCGYAHHAALQMDPTQRPAKPSAPLDSHGLLKTLEPPAAPAVSQQIVNVRLKHSAAGRRHAQEASTVWVSDSPVGSGDASTGAGPPVL